MPALRLALALTIGASVAVGQTPTLVASATQALSVVAGNTSQTLPIGPLPQNSVSLAASGPGGSSSLHAAPLGGNGYRLWTNAVLVPSFFAPPVFSADGEITLELTLPTPTPVLIVVSGSATASTGASAGTHVDVGDDGTVEATIASGSPGVDREFGLVVGPTGSRIRLLHTSSGFSPFLQPLSAASSVTISFFAGNAPLESYGVGCLPLGWTRSATGAAILSCPAVPGSLALFAVGGAQISVPLPIQPGCNLLTDVLATVAVVPVAGAASLSLVDVAPPAGSMFTFQAAVLEPTLALPTSNGLVMTGR